MAGQLKFWMPTLFWVWPPFTERNTFWTSPYQGETHFWKKLGIELNWCGNRGRVHFSFYATPLFVWCVNFLPLWTTLKLFEHPLPPHFAQPAPLRTISECPLTCLQKARENHIRYKTYDLIIEGALLFKEDASKGDVTDTYHV